LPDVPPRCSWIKRPSIREPLLADQGKIAVGGRSIEIFVSR
jgi:hypothetical protein